MLECEVLSVILTDKDVGIEDLEFPPEEPSALLELFILLEAAMEELIVVLVLPQVGTEDGLSKT